MKTELKHKEFELKNGVPVLSMHSPNYGYRTQAEANEYAKLKCEWWGSNLVYLGAEEKNGLWFPGFNVWN
jgi:hypothetical protein